MEFMGSWRQCLDGIVRPMIKAEVEGSNGQLYADWFLLDIGADCTVLRFSFLQRLQLPPVGTPGFTLTGVGTSTPIPLVLVAGKLKLTSIDGHPATIPGPLASFTSLRAVEHSILGREVINEFDFLLEKKRGAFRLLHGVHSCQVVGP